jgi:hypothetical protein
MTRPAFIEIDGKPVRWRDLVARRREQLRACATAAQPTLFELKEDCRPESERTAAGRYSEPNLFSSRTVPFARSALNVTHTPVHTPSHLPKINNILPLVLLSIPRSFSIPGRGHFMVI